MDIEYVKSLIVKAENRNKIYLTEADCPEDAIDVAEEYIKLLYRDEVILEVIQQLVKKLGKVPNEIWTPSGEIFNILHSNYSKDEGVFEVIQQIDKNLKTIPNGIWTPSGEDFNIYVSKCYLLAIK